MSDKLPAFQFYPGDWRKDPNVQACSFAARGLWLEMLCLMHESTQRGYLVIAGRPVTPEQLARQAGGDADEVRALLSELEAAGVFSRDEGGVIYSRRMDRDDHIRRVRSEAGKLGAVHGCKGGRPRKDGTEKRQKGQTEPQTGGVASGGYEPHGGQLGEVVGLRSVEDALGGDENGKKRQTEGQTERQIEGQNISPSSSSSSSEYISAVAGRGTKKVRAKREKANAGNVPIPPLLDTPDFRAAWADWLAARQSRRRPVTELAARSQLESLIGIGPVSAIACIQASIRNDWQGLFPDRFRGHTSPRPGLFAAAKPRVDICEAPWQSEPAPAMEEPERW